MSRSKSSILKQKFNLDEFDGYIILFLKTFHAIYNLNWV